ncbi:tyrosine-type recombinase/integrase [Streptomyces sp. AN-3]|uniref:tyrosine-type recombinase/integrase n=1 Tax=Streptomyces sp. AN-3 TaxID=3044177 RepID=UPI00249CE77D|nr:tyrosine-type recombinase/integrase [Streptomyces sp. AN-3]MDI3102060.1 tyrosine-type recombinase/integrase [Streptomyces sp. AN-3]
MTLRDKDEIVDAEIVDDGALALAEEPPPPPLVDHNTVLYPGQELPTAADGPKYSERDLYVSDETAAILQDTDPTDTGPMRAFKEWCAQQGRVPVPCTTATYTEYGRHLMARGLKVSTITNYMSRIKTAMPPGKKPDNSLFLRLLEDYRTRERRALRVRRAFPITLPYLVPMMEKAEQSGRPAGLRDAAMFAFGYSFLGRSIEDTNLEIEDLTILSDRMLVWVPEDKSHKGEDQTIPLRNRSDVQLIPRMNRWLAYLAEQGITEGPVFRHLLKNGKVATAETRAKKAPVRGEKLRGHFVNERVKFWFAKAGLVGDGRPITSHGLRAGAATDLAAAKASAVTIRKAGRWREGSRIPEEVYVRPTEDLDLDVFERVPLHDPEAP